MIMKLELSKEGLIHLVCGTQPDFGALAHPDVSAVCVYNDTYGRYLWDRAKLRTFSEKELIDLYHVCITAVEARFFNRTFYNSIRRNSMNSLQFWDSLTLEDMTLREGDVLHNALKPDMMVTIHRVSKSGKTAFFRTEYHGDRELKMSTMMCCSYTNSNLGWGQSGKSVPRYNFYMTPTEIMERRKSVETV